MKKLFLISIVQCCLLGVMAQNQPASKSDKKAAKRQRINEMIRLEEEGVLQYKKHFAGGIKLSNDGYGGWIEYAHAQSVKKSLLFQIEIAERKHPKEEKLQDIYGLAAPIIYGKINFFYPIKLGVQQQILLGNKGNKNGVCVTANFGGGVSLGLLRPYLIQVYKGNDQYEYVGYNSPDSLYFLDVNNFASGPGFGTGWKNMTMIPGLYVKPSVRFDYGKFNEMVSALEVGVQAEYYTKPIPQMVYQKQEKLYLSAYVSLVFGRRK